MAVSVIIHPLLTVITVVDVISIPFVRNSPFEILIPRQQLGPWSIHPKVRL